jgi:hypothetical protein
MRKVLEKSPLITETGLPRVYYCDTPHHQGFVVLTHTKPSAKKSDQIKADIKLILSGKIQS